MHQRITQDIIVVQYRYIHDEVCYNFEHKIRLMYMLLGALPPDPHQGLCPWTPLGDFRPPDPLIWPPKVGNRSTPLAGPNAYLLLFHVKSNNVERLCQQ